MIRIAKGTKFTWYDVENPTAEDVKRIKKEIRIHEIVLNELIPQVRHPKLDMFGSHVFLVLTIPTIERDGDGKAHEVRLEELDIIFSPNWVLTSHYRSIDAVDALFERVERERETRVEYLDTNPAGLVYTILSTILQKTIASLGVVEERVERAEASVFSGMQRKMVRELSELRRDIIDFNRALSPSRPVFRILDDTAPALLGAETLPYFRNLTGRIEQIATLLKTLNETVKALEETNQSLLTTRTNDIIRVLTIFATTMLPLTLIASIFGMNIPLPSLAQHLSFFWWISAIMTSLIAVMLLFFRRKHWL